AKPEQVPLPQDEVDAEVDVADVDFVHEFESSLGFLESLNTKQLDKHVQQGPGKSKAKVSSQAPTSDSDSDSPEAAYERAPRQRLQDMLVSEQTSLPTKNLHGELVYAKSKSGTSAAQQVQVPQVEGITVTHEDYTVSEEQPSDSALGSSSSDSDPESPKATTSSKSAAKQQKPISSNFAAVAEQHNQQGNLGPDAELQEFQNVQERREELKQQMAVTASKLLQNPEANLPTMRSLLTLAADKDVQVSRLAMLSLLAVFKDILPGYRIRLPTEKELEIPVSKEVKQTRDYESMQLRFYQAYLKLLLQAIGSKSNPAKNPAQARVAARCMCGMLSALHHFNYSTDLLQAVVPLMANKDDQLRQLSCDAIKEVLVNDEEGKVAVESVQLVADLIKRRKCACPAEMVTTLLVLKLKDAEHQSVSKGKKKGVKTKGKSKKTRRADEVEKAFKEADASADRAAARVTQSQMLLALFEVFFRVLKQCTQSGIQAQQAQGYRLTPVSAQKRFPLLMPTLDGLTKYAHLIDVDYFADLLQVMQQIMHMTALPLQQRLRTLLTASDILKGQGEALNIDRRDLYARLYACIPELALLPLQPDDGNLDDLLSQDSTAEPLASQPSSQERPQVVLLLCVAQQMLLEQSKALDTARMAAFTKSLSCGTLHLESGAAMGCLSLVNRLLRHNMKLRSLLEHEAGAPPPAWAAASATGLTDSDSAVSGAPLWELSLLTSHYHPHLSQAAAAVAHIPPQGSGGGGGHSVLASAMDPSTLAHTYITDQGNFKPAPQPPRKALTASKHPKLPAFALLTSAEEEKQFLTSLSTGQDAVMADAEGSLGEADEHAVGEEEVQRVLQQWFRKQKHFQENMMLRRQRAHIMRQMAKLQQHVEKQGQQASKQKAVKPIKQQRQHTSNNKSTT
ncbi:MAG: hypothetical protein FRX49_04067, partial [Trebouxia sp. A1-2]